MRNSSILFLFCIFNLCVNSQSNPTTIQLPSQKSNPNTPIINDLCPISKPLSCPVNCFRTDPVCGVDGVTYWCGCADAHCSGTPVAKLGFCDVGNEPVSGQALLLVHIVWLIVLGFSVLFGLL
ncbi:hypothetical protein ACHQM5_010527 [Ranunculus cassubicifolius]